MIESKAKQEPDGTLSPSHQALWGGLKMLCGDSLYNAGLQGLRFAARACTSSAATMASQQKA